MVMKQAAPKPTKKPEVPADGTDTAPEISAAAADTDPAPKPEDGPTLDEAIAKLKTAETERDAATARATAAERTAAAATATAATVQTEKASTELQLVTNAIETVKGTQAALKTALREARAAGDTDAEFEILDKVAGAAHDLRVLEHGKANMEAAAAAPKRPTGNLVDAAASAMEKNNSPNSAAWIRAHPEFITDPRKNDRMMQAHYAAKAEGLREDTPEYISSIEITLGMRKSEAAPEVTKKDDEEVEAATAATGGRRALPPAAPPSRGGDAPGRMTLSGEEREMAEMMFPDLKKADAYKSYAENKLALQKEGRITSH